MCSGRVDMEFVFRAFLNSADGVFICACRLNECNYITHGNYTALNMVLLSKRVLQHIGLNPARLRIEFMSSSDGLLFARVMNEFIEQLQGLGPLGEGEGLTRDEAVSRIRRVVSLVPYLKVALRDKLTSRLEDPAKWESHFSREEVAQLLDSPPSFYIDPDRCRGCMVCLKNCPVGAIDGARKKIHIINQQKCIRCGTCLEVCPFEAVRRLEGEPVPPPVPEEKRTISSGD